MSHLSLLQISSGGSGGEAPPTTEPLRTLRAKGETTGSRRKALNLTTLPTREASDDLA
jgi:hypothetical protein